jgi:two-component system, sensor histidine kinase and response regulator
MPAVIMIVDDDPQIREVLSRYARQMGHTVMEGSNGEEAMHLLTEASHSIDLLLTDIMMPRMSGIELLRAAHEILPDLPIAMITGAATLDNSIAALNAGAYAYLVKPVKGEDVRDVINRGLRLVDQVHTRQSLENELAARYQMLEDQLALLQDDRPANTDPLADLIRGLRHELGNATTAIKLNLSVLEQEGGSSVVLREHLSDLETSTDELVSLIMRLKQYPRVTALNELVNMREAMNSLAMTAHDKLNENEIHLTIDLPEEDVLVHGRDLELTRVCGHILDNAIEATAQTGGHHVWINIKTDDTTVTLTFGDEGPGFPAEIPEEIFSPGYTTKITKGVVRGLGLGLFMARATINLYGGRIWLENRSGGGANVHIRLPLAFVHQDLPPAQSSKA